jgi:hypothetical protein
MDKSLREIIWNQFGATIDMLENAISLCPENLWNDNRFWYAAYHAIFYLDYYLSTHPDEFAPPSPFNLSEFDPQGKMPERIYSKNELLDYLEFARKKCFDLINDLTDENAAKRFVNEYRNYSRFEIILYNMRHVQHHAGQFNLLLRQNIDDAPKWVSQTKRKY